MPVADRVRLIEALLDAGLRHIEVAAFVSPEGGAGHGRRGRRGGGARPPPRACCSPRSCPTAGAPSWPSSAGVDELTVTISASRDLQPAQRAPHGGRVRGRGRRDLLAAGARGRARRRGRVVCVRLALRGRHRALGGGRAWPTGCSTWACDRLTYADTTGMATPAAGPRRSSTRPESNVGLHLHQTRGTGAAQRLGRARAGGAALRHLGRGPRRLALRRRRGAGTWPPRSWWRSSTTAAS